MTSTWNISNIFMYKKTWSINIITLHFFNNEKTAPVKANGKT